MIKDKPTKTTCVISVELLWCAGVREVELHNASSKCQI